MDVDFAILADAAEAANGKVSLIGGAFDTIWASGVPVAHPRLSLVIRLMFTPAELGRNHNLEVHVMNADGRRIASVGGSMQLGARNPGLPAGWRQGLLSILNFVNLSFPAFGTYQFEIVVNNTSIKTIPLIIAQQVPVAQ